MRGPTSTKTNIKLFVDPEGDDRDNDTTPDCLGSKQSVLEDDVSHKCSCCEAVGTQWERTRNLPTKKPSVRFSSLTDADINFFEKGNTDAQSVGMTVSPAPESTTKGFGNGAQVLCADKHSFDRVRRFKSQ